MIVLANLWKRQAEVIENTGFSIDRSKWILSCYLYGEWYKIISEEVERTEKYPRKKIDGVGEGDGEQ